MHLKALSVVPLIGWYLFIAGISPHLQRRRLGEKLLRPTLMEADTARVTCYLETFNPDSIPFYNKMGF
jgi:ribosomal protein S18 acetylase RimI-like enzyme